MACQSSPSFITPLTQSLTPCFLSQSYIWAGVRAGADILIAVAIVVYQQTDKTTIPLAQSPIKRYTLMLVSTGAVSCVISVVTFVLLVAKPKGHVGAFLCLLPVFGLQT